MNAQKQEDRLVTPADFERYARYLEANPAEPLGYSKRKGSTQKIRRDLKRLRYLWKHFGTLYMTGAAPWDDTTADRLSDEGHRSPRAVPPEDLQRLVHEGCRPGTWKGA